MRSRRVTTLTHEGVIAKGDPVADATKATHSDHLMFLQRMDTLASDKRNIIASIEAEQLRSDLKAILDSVYTQAHIPNLSFRDPQRILQIIDNSANVMLNKNRKSFIAQDVVRI